MMWILCKCWIQFISPMVIVYLWNMPFSFENSNFIVNNRASIGLWAKLRNRIEIVHRERAKKAVIRCRTGYALLSAELSTSFLNTAPNWTLNRFLQWDAVLNKGREVLTVGLAIEGDVKRVRGISHQRQVSEVSETREWVMMLLTV